MRKTVSWFGSAAAAVALWASVSASGLLILCVFVACAHVITPTPVVGPDGGVYPLDVFTGAQPFCDDEVVNPPLSSVLVCADGPEILDVDSCLIGLVNVRTLTEVVCTARDLSQSLHSVARQGMIGADAGTEIGPAAREALALDFWMRRHNILIRSH